jgi:hypothetical protein
MSNVGFNLVLARRGWFTYHLLGLGLHGLINLSLGVTAPPRGWGSSTKINISDSRWSENTINTYKYNTIYRSSSISYYKLVSCFKYTKGLKLKDNSKDSFRVCGSGNTLVQDILFAQEENAIHQRSKPEDLSMVSNLNRFGPPIGIPHRHHWKEEETPHLHTWGKKSKAWATMLSKTYPWWSEDHHQTRSGFNLG